MLLPKTLYPIEDNGLSKLRCPNTCFNEYCKNDMNQWKPLMIVVVNSFILGFTLCSSGDFVSSSSSRVSLFFVTLLEPLNCLCWQICVSFCANVLAMRVINIFVIHDRRIGRHKNYEEQKEQCSFLFHFSRCCYYAMIGPKEPKQTRTRYQRKMVEWNCIAGLHTVVGPLVLKDSNWIQAMFHHDNVKVQHCKPNYECKQCVSCQVSRESCIIKTHIIFAHQHHSLSSSLACVKIAGKISSTTTASK